MSQKFKVLLAFAAFFLVSTSALSYGACANSTYVEPEDCMAKAIDPEGGNCWWAADFNSCEIYAETEALCKEYCTSCLNCLHRNGCCRKGNLDKIKSCEAMCVANIQNM